MFSLHSSPHQGQPSHPNSPLSVLLAWQKQNWVFPRSPSPIWLLSSSKGEVSAKLLPLPNSYQTCLPTKKKPKMNFPGQWQSPNIRTDLFPGVTEWRQDAKLLSHIPLPLGKTIKSVWLLLRNRLPFPEGVKSFVLLLFPSHPRCWKNTEAP